MIKGNISTNIRKIDVIRGISILLVFSYHSFLELGTTGKLSISLPQNGYFFDFQLLSLKQWVILFSPLFYGASGVQIFLLISGFLIHYSYLKNQKNSFDFGSFLQRRFWRIYPPYLLALFFFVFCWKINNKVWWDLEKMKYLFSHLTMTYNLYEDHIYQINSSFWSLALECQLYLIYPIVLWGRKKWTIKTMFWITMGIYIVAVVLEIVYFKRYVSWNLSLLKNWQIWTLGALLAENYIHGNQIFKRVRLPILLVMITGFFLLSWSNFSQYAIHFYAALIAAILIEKYLFSKLNVETWLEKMLIPVGLCSYSLYLFHQPLLGFLYKSVSIGGFSEKYSSFLILDIIIVFGIVFCLAYSLYIFVEIPFINLGKKLMKQRKTLSIDNVYLSNIKVPQE
jgi:peptidoglycan/LPS O-acetylase OafA/YrhL